MKRHVNDPIREIKEGLGTDREIWIASILVRRPATGGIPRALTAIDEILTSLLAGKVGWLRLPVTVKRGYNGAILHELTYLRTNERGIPCYMGHCHLVAFTLPYITLFKLKDGEIINQMPLDLYDAAVGAWQMGEPGTAELLIRDHLAQVLIRDHLARCGA